ncbi:MAG: ABC transporter permease [Acetatifactor sp.]|nr:ABC transporter permease [Acetatifactor sp.]
MNIFRQLFRQPVRMIAVLLLLGMTASFFSLGAGVLASARATADEVDRSFVTIGIPTTETETVSAELDNGMVIEYEKSIIPFEAWDYLDQMAEEGTLIREVSRLKAVSAYSPSVFAVTSAGEPGKYAPQLDEPYNAAIFVISVTSAGEWDEFNGQGYIQIEADVVEAVMLHPDYTPRTHMTCSVGLASRAEYEALDIRPGRRYLVYGKYCDNDLQLRTGLAWGGRCSLDEIRYENINYDIPEDVLEEMERRSSEENYESPVAQYLYDERGGGRYLFQYDLDSIDRCYMTVTDRVGRDLGPTFDSGGEQIERDLGDYLCDVYMTPLDTELEAFLDSDEGDEWKQAIRQLEIQYHCVTVLGTELVEGIYSFHEGDCFVSQGRSFTPKEYEEGANSCIISETTALASGLEVGDEIELSFYWGEDYDAAFVDEQGCLTTESYSEKVGVSGEGKTYKIVGIYRQSRLWEESVYSFKPNTIFVPGRSLAEPYHSGLGFGGAFVSLIIPNGKVEEVKAAFAQQGYPEDIFLFYDNGYAEIEDTISGFLHSSAQLFGVSALVCVTALAVYLAVFVFRQRRTAGLMLSLGSGRRYTRRSIFALAMLSVGISTVIGALAGLFFMDTVLQRVFSAASELMSTSFSGGSVSGHAALDSVMVSLPYMAILAALAQLILYGAVIFACVGSMVRKPPLELIRKG